MRSECALFTRRADRAQLRVTALDGKALDVRGVSVARPRPACPAPPAPPARPKLMTTACGAGSYTSPQVH